MKKIPVIVGFVILISYGLCTAATAPFQIGGIVLGGSVEDYKDKLKMETAMPIRHKEYLQEVQTRELEGFRSGRIWFGAVTSPSRIFRISLKFADSSREFYDVLLDAYKRRFGKPKEWRGDSFGILVAWKWSFKDSQNNRISLILQHNLEYPNLKIGNCVKLTMWNLIETESRLFKQKYPDRSKPKKIQKIDPDQYDPKDLDRFIPR